MNTLVEHLGIHSFLRKKICCILFFIFSPLASASEEGDVVILIHSKEESAALSHSAWSISDFINAKPPELRVSSILPSARQEQEDVFSSRRDAISRGEAPSEPWEYDLGSAGTRLHAPVDIEAFVGNLDHDTSIEENIEMQDGSFYYTSSRINPRTSNKSYPYRTVGKLFFKNKVGQNFTCSASVISRRVVVTAGHCVHDGISEKFNSFVFIPGFDNGDAPFGVWDQTSFVAMSKGWKESGGFVPAYDDYALLVFDDEYVSGRSWALSELVGSMGWHSHNFWENHITGLGYPSNIDSARIMQVTNSQTEKKGAKNTYLIGSDMRQGASGGPLVQNFQITGAGRTATPGKKGYARRVVSVMSYVQSSPNVKFIAGSEFDTTFINMWDAACAAGDGLNCH